jgi:hypothetical protein
MRYKGIHPNDINEVSQSVVSIYAGGEEKLTLSGSSANFSTSVSASQFSGSFIGDGSQLTGLGADSPFTQTASYYSANTDLKVTGSFDVDGIIKERARVLIPTLLEDLVLDQNAANVFSGDVMTDENGEAIIFDGDGGDNLFPLTGSSITVGSANVDGTVTANAFIGDGSGITGLDQALPDNVVSSSAQTKENLLNQNLNLGTGELSASAANLTGDIRIGGNIILGDDIATDEIEVQAALSGSLIPSENAEYDLGSPTREWRDLYLSTGSLFIGGRKVLEEQQLSFATGSILESDEGMEFTSSADFIMKSTNGKFSLFNNDDENIFEVDNGVVNLRVFDETPNAAQGGIFFSSSNELYVATG